MRRYLVASAMLAIALVSSASVAGPMQKEAVSDRSGERAIEQFYTDLYAQKFERALADIRDLAPDSSNREGQAVVWAMRAVAQLGLKHNSEANRLIARVH